jgi:hypothetical protein
MRSPFYATGPRGGLWDKLSAEIGTNLPDLGGTFAGATMLPAMFQLHPLVPPQVLHFMQVPFRTSV